MHWIVGSGLMAPVVIVGAVVALLVVGVATTAGTPTNLLADPSGILAGCLSAFLLDPAGARPDITQRHAGRLPCRAAHDAAVSPLRALPTLFLARRGGARASTTCRLLHESRAHPVPARTARTGTDHGRNAGDSKLI